MAIINKVGTEQPMVVARVKKILEMASATASLKKKPAKPAGAF